MNKLKTFMFVAAAAMTLASCSNDDDMIQNAPKKNVSFTATMPALVNDTRTSLEFDEEKTPYVKWQSNEIMDFLTDKGSGSLYADSEDSVKTTFSLLDFLPFYEEHLGYLTDAKFLFTYHINNNSELKRSLRQNESLLVLNYLGENTIETSPYNVFDLSMADDVLVSQKILNPDTSLPVNLQLKRLTSVIRLNIINATGDPQYDDMLISTGSPIYFAKKSNSNFVNFSSEMRYNFDNGEYTVSNNCDDFSLTFDYDYNNTDRKYFLRVSPSSDNNQYAHPIYFTVLPTKFPSGNELQIAFILENLQTVTKTLKFNQDVDIKPGTITTFNIKLTKENLS